MAEKTTIEWTRGADGLPGATWNPVTGCSKVSPGCKFCYAERLFRRFSREVVQTRDASFVDGLRPRRFTDVRLHEDRLDEPLRWRRPRRVFVCSMSDLFHAQVPAAFIRRIFKVMREARHHTYQILTKRPDRMREMMRAWVDEGIFWAPPGATGPQFPFPHVWLGTSAEDQATLDERCPHLVETPAAVRFLSLEPLLGSIIVDWRSSREQHAGYHSALDGSPISWVIVGGESGPSARPVHPDWVRSVRDQCVAAGVPFFFKQWGEWIPKLQMPDSARYTGTWGTLNINGNWFPLTTPWNGRQGEDSETREYVMVRVGKRAAGRVLDGRTWDEYPGGGAEVR